MTFLKTNFGFRGITSQSMKDVKCIKEEERNNVRSNLVRRRFGGKREKGDDDC
jgi:hypothetical protein